MHLSGAKNPDYRIIELSTFVPEITDRNRRNYRSGVAEVPIGAAVRIAGSYLVQQPLPADELHHFTHPVSLTQVGENEGPVAALLLRIRRHDVKIRAHMRRKVSFVNDQQVRTRNAGSALARYLLAAGHVDT